MDPTLMSCPTCGHSVSNIAGACTYCGAVVDEKGPPPQADINDYGDKAQMIETPPPLPNQQTPPADEMPDAAVENPLAAPEQSESDTSPQTDDSPATVKSVEPATDAQAASPAAEEASEPAAEAQAASPAAAKTSEPATDAQAASSVELTSVEAGAEGKTAVDDQELEPVPESGQLNRNREDESEIDLTEIFESESAPDAAAEEKPGTHEPEGETDPASDNVILLDRHENQTESAAEDTQSPPEPERVDKSGNETGEPEIPGDIRTEPVGIDAAEQKSASPSTAGTSPSLEKPGQEAETEPVEEVAPTNKADITADAAAEPTSKSSGDTIILEIENEIEPAAAASEDEPVAAASPDKVEEPAQSKLRTEPKKENKPNAGLTKAQTVNNQKLALAKAQAKSQANTEAKKKKAPAAAAPPPKLNPAQQTSGRMHKLLEKYKGRVIGINYDNSADFRKAQLVEANAEYFSVFVKDQNLKYSYPLKAVLSIIEGKDGVDTGDSKQPNKFIAVVKVYPLVLF